jgi:hypothetical protein
MRDEKHLFCGNCKPGKGKHGTQKKFGFCGLCGREKLVDDLAVHEDCWQQLFVNKVRALRAKHYLENCGRKKKKT